MITLLYFAHVRETVGLGEERLALPSEIATPRDLASWLASRGGGYEAAFANPERLRCAIDQTLVSFDAALGNACEIAFFPPVTGG